MEIKNEYKKKKIFDELINKQLKNINIERKLFNKDLRRIVKYIDNDIFDDEKCCLWNGYVTNELNSKRGTYVNFFFRNKKVALHRLLYENFVEPLGDDNYLKFSCDNSDNYGKCCNINHMVKYKYNNKCDNNNDGNKNNENSNGNNNSNSNSDNFSIKKNNLKKQNIQMEEFMGEDLILVFD